MSQQASNPAAPRSSARILAADGDPEMLERVTAALRLPMDDRCDSGEADGSPAGGGAIAPDGLGFSSHAIESLVDLHRLNLEQYDLLLCGCGLVDASGLDALAYVRGVRPELPVVFVSPEEDSTFAVEAIRAGAMDFLVATEVNLRSLPLLVEKTLTHQRTRIENRRLQQRLSRSLAELAVTNHRLQDLVGQFEVLARTDELTGLANRRWLNVMLEHHWAHATRHDLPLGMLMIDLDGFKRINDALGHQRGDELLRLTAGVIRTNVRAVDLAVRYGGDEFCVLLPHTAPREVARIARRVLREFRLAMNRQNDVACMLGMSIGMAHVSLSRPINADHLLRHADQALYDAKTRGRNRIRVRRGSRRRPGTAMELTPPFVTELAHAG